MAHASACGFLLQQDRSCPDQTPQAEACATVDAFSSAWLHTSKSIWMNLQYDAPPVTNHQSPVTRFTALRDGIAQLEREHVPSAALAAELLLMHTLGRDRAWIYAHPEHELDATAREQYFSLIARRASGVPTQHLTGHQEFWGLDFEVTPDVLIPRPETEHVIEVALERLGVSSEAGSPRRNEEFRIADVGTGSGCIAIALAHELPAAQIIATDISAAALEVARRNAARHGVASRDRFH